MAPHHSPAKHRPPTPGSSAPPRPQAARQPHPTSAQTSHFLPPAAVGGLTRRPLGESPGAQRWVPEAIPRSWAWVRHSTIPTLQSTGLRYGILGAPPEPQEGGASGCCLPGSLHPEMLRDVDLGSRSQGRSQPSLALCFARDEGGPPQPGGPEPVSSGCPTFCSPCGPRCWPIRPSWGGDGGRRGQGAHSASLTDPLPSPSVFLENRAGARQPCSLRPFTLRLKAHDFLLQSPSSLQNLALLQPGLPGGTLPAPPTPMAHLLGDLGNPLPSLGLRFWAAGQACVVAQRAARTGLGGGEHGGPGSEPEALSLPNPSWLSLALSGPL